MTPAPVPPLLLLQLALVPPACWFASPPLVPGDWLAPVAPVPPLPPTTRLLVSVTCAFCVIWTATDGAPCPAPAAEPRILKFSSTTGLAPVMLTAGSPPGGATIAERND